MPPFTIYWDLVKIVELNCGKVEAIFVVIMAVAIGVVLLYIYKAFIGKPTETSQKWYGNGFSSNLTLEFMVCYGCYGCFL